MELELIRTYYTDGVNGVLQASSPLPPLLRRRKGEFNEAMIICQTIELPWRENAKRISCIPEGRYELTKRYSPRFGWHLLVNHVAGRSFILIHAFNDALKESKGCIAPVSECTGHGKGINSRASLKKLLDLVYPVFESGNKVFLKIISIDRPHPLPPSP